MPLLARSWLREPRHWTVAADLSLMWAGLKELAWLALELPIATLNSEKALLLLKWLW